MKIYFAAKRLESLAVINCINQGTFHYIFPGRDDYKQLIKTKCTDMGG